jgi:protein transport protein SEC61 subunit alpha
LSPPRDLTDIFRDPLHFVTHIIFIMGACGLFARYWIEISGEGPRDVAKKLKD